MRSAYARRGVAQPSLIVVRWLRPIRRVTELCAAYGTIEVVPSVLFVVIPRSDSDEGSAVSLDSRELQIPRYARDDNKDGLEMRAMRLKAVPFQISRPLLTIVVKTPGLHSDRR
jgi:hypothetical protein